MRIGVNALFMIPYKVGGSEVYLRQTLMAIASGFPEIAIVVFSNRENDNLLKNELSPFSQVEFELMNFNASNRYERILREQFELPYRAIKRSIDVLWSPGYTMPLFMSCPQVASILDMQYKNYPGDFSFLARQMMDILVNFACRKSSAIITISDFSKREIVKYTKSKAQKIQVTPLAADPQFSEPLSPRTRKQLLGAFVPDEIPYILSVANTYPHKNMHMLVDAFGLLTDKLPHNLIIVGNPHRAEDKLKDSLSKLKYKKRFMRLQNLSKQQLAALYQGADIFVFPSLYEGFGLPVLEAMISGVPVVTTNKASTPEVGGDYVQYVDSISANEIAKQIVKIAKWSDSYREQKITDAMQWAAAFSWEKTAQQTISVLKAIT